MMAGTSIKITALIVLTLLITAPAQAGEKKPAIYLSMGGGLTTHKSEFVVSNDTSYSYHYAFGINGGSDSQLTMFLSTAVDSTKFELNSSEVSNEFQDTVIRYSYGPFYLGAVVNQTKMVISRLGDVPAEIDAIATGYGVALGGNIEVGRDSSIFLDVTSVSTPTVKEINQAVFTIGNRLDISLGGSYSLARSWLDGVVGLRQRTYQVSLDGASSAELITTTWFGLSLFKDF